MADVEKKPVICEIIYNDVDVAKILEAASKQKLKTTKLIKQEITNSAAFPIWKGENTHRYPRGWRDANSDTIVKTISPTNAVSPQKYHKELPSSGKNRPSPKGHLSTEKSKKSLPRSLDIPGTSKDRSSSSARAERLVDSQGERVDVTALATIFPRPQSAKEEYLEEHIDVEVEEEIPELHSDEEDAGLEVEVADVVITHESPAHPKGDMEDIHSEFAALVQEEELRDEDEFADHIYASEYQHQRYAAKHEVESAEQPPPQGNITEMMASYYSATQQKKTHKCEICEKSYSAKYTLKLHMRLHTGEKPYPCMGCDKAFPKRSQLDSHMRTHYTEHFTCEVCKQIFSNKNDLTLHMEASGCIEDLTCKICNKTFHNRSNLGRHVLLHSSVHPFTCMYCNRSFAVKASYVRHLGSHSAKKAHICPTCGRGYNQKTELKIHMVKCDLEDKPFQCEVCKKAYAELDQLRMHMQKHSPNNPFICEVCNKPFSTGNSLKIHMYTHTGQYPLKCQFCGKGFSQRGTLRAHVRTHTGERPFMCKICGRSFGQKPGLTVHMTLIHPEYEESN